LELKTNKKTIFFVISIIILLSALIYNLLYINNKKNEIIEEIEFEDEEDLVEEEIKTIFVDIGGEVINPGLYELAENSRINDAINIAGGTTEKADLTDVNLAYILSDAMKIVIPRKEVKKVTTKVTSSTPNIVSMALSTTQDVAEKNVGKVNINLATKEQLKTLDGIGDATAQKIIDYRKENGNFGSVEDIKNVSGIGENKYEKIKEKIII